MKGAEAAKDDQEWFLPVESNGFKRFVRVVITTKDEATLLVVFSDPMAPEYSIQNKTNLDVEVYQKGLKNPSHFFCHSFKNTAFAWEDRFKKERFLEVNCGGVIESVDIEKVAKGEPHKTKPQNKATIGVAVMGSNKALVI